MGENLKKFKPFGPYNLKFETLPGGKRITKEHTNLFKSDLSEKIRNGKGIYIFGMTVTKGITPCYVGKTNNSFENECFTGRNLNIYNGQILAYKRKHKPFLFFLVYQYQKNHKISNKIIKELEKYVINLALEKNSHLANIQGAGKSERFYIDCGGSSGGRPTKEGSFFKKMMKF